jgi:hypothetical protein
MCVYYLEWLNELVRFVVNGAYDRLFIENPNLRDFLTNNQDDQQSIEIMNKLNNDQELVKD